MVRSLRATDYWVLGISPGHSVPGRKMKSCLEMNSTNNALIKSNDWSFVFFFFFYLILLHNNLRY